MFHIKRARKTACLRKGLANEIMPKFSVVALYCDFNEPGLTKLAKNNIEQLIDITPTDAELILVINEMSNNLSEFLKNKDVMVVSTNKNVGCVVKNLGYEIAQGEYVFSIDHDVFVRNRTAFDKCVQFLDDNPKTAIIGPCGGNINDNYWSEQNWGIGAYDIRKDYVPGKADVFGYNDQVYFGGQEQLDGTAVDSIPSLFWCFRKSLIQQIGPLDWRFGPFVGSDADFCFRAKKEGHEVRIMRVPIEHINGGSCSHKNQDNLPKVHADHLKALYNKWHPHLSVVFENYKT